MRVIAAAVLGPRGLLLVSKRAAPDVYYLPGGKPEPGEAPLDCLGRELAEELGVGIERPSRSPRCARRPRSRACEMWMTVFLARLGRRPEAGRGDRRVALVAADAASRWRRRCATA